MKRKYRLMIWATLLTVPWISQLMFPQADYRELLYWDILVIVLGGIYEIKMRGKE